jgi:putative endonuclease
VAYRVYVIQNREEKFYIGLSDDVARRIDQHNGGESTWTRGKGPWTLKWQSEEMNLSNARKLELLLKRQKGGHSCYRSVRLELMTNASQFSQTEMNLSEKAFHSFAFTTVHASV